MSITGLSRWLLMHIRGGELDGVRILDAASIAATQRVANPQLKDNQALVWYYAGHAGRTWLSHSESAFGSSNQMLYHPASGRGIIVLTNSDVYLRERIGLRQGSQVIEEIITRLDAEADAL